MSLVREVLAFCFLAASIVAAAPAVVALEGPVRAVASAAGGAGLGSSEAREAVQQVLAAGPTPVVWICLAALFFGNFVLVRLWGCLARL